MNLRLFFTTTSALFFILFISTANSSKISQSAALYSSPNEEAESCLSRFQSSLIDCGKESGLDVESNSQQQPDKTLEASEKSCCGVVKCLAGKSKEVAESQECKDTFEANIEAVKGQLSEKGGCDQYRCSSGAFKLTPFASVGVFVVSAILCKIALFSY